MTKITYSQDIARDKLFFNSRKSQEIISDYRLYKIDKSGKVRGYWQDNNKLYKDKISFVNFKHYNNAKKQALKILQDTQEIAVSIEDIKKNILYIVYKDKTLILRIKRSFKTLDKRQALKIAYKLTREQNGATLYKDKLYYKIISYK